MEPWCVKHLGQCLAHSRCWEAPLPAPRRTWAPLLPALSYGDCRLIRKVWLKLRCAHWGHLFRLLPFSEYFFFFFFFEDWPQNWLFKWRPHNFYQTHWAHTLVYFENTPDVCVRGYISATRNDPLSVEGGHSEWVADLVKAPRLFDHVQPTCVPECRYANTPSRPPGPHGLPSSDSVWDFLMLFFQTKPISTHRFCLWPTNTCDFGLWEQTRGVIESRRRIAHGPWRCG